MVVMRSVVRDNQAGIGGGIFAGDAVIDSSQIAGNEAGIGGGVYNGSGQLILNDSSVVRNKAISGGGLHTSSLAERFSLIRNSTIAHNEAGTGGGIGTHFGIVAIEHSTISGNTVSSGSGAGVWSAGTSSSVVRVQSSIIAGNAGPDVETANGRESLRFVWLQSDRQRRFNIGIRAAGRSSWRDGTSFGTAGLQRRTVFSDRSRMLTRAPYREARRLMRGIRRRWRA